MIARVCLLLMLLPLAVVDAADTSAKKPSVLFIAIDDLNISLACYGHPQVKTPNVDRLAARGVKFDRAFCNYPVCNPSRSSFMTGLRPETTRVLDNKTRLRENLPNVITLPQLFRQNGYFTARVGKIFHDGIDDPKAWDIALDNKMTETGAKGEGRDLTAKHRDFCHWTSAEGEEEDQQDGQTAREAIRLISEQRDKPFFVAVGFRRPHDPWVAPKKFFDLYPIESIKLPEKPPSGKDIAPITFTQHNMRGEVDDEHAREFIRAYYASISFMDSQLGRVFDAMDSQKLWDNTFVVFVSDHGWQEGTHGGLWLKATLFEECTRVPLIVAAPQIEPATCPRIVELVDLFPTIAQFCEINPPEGLEGISFVPLLHHPEIAWKSAAFTVVSRGQKLGKSMHTERYRYTEWPEGTVELYDLQTDPHEYENVATKPESKELLVRMKVQFQAGWRGARPN